MGYEESLFQCDWILCKKQALAALKNSLPHDAVVIFGGFPQSWGSQ